LKSTVIRQPSITWKEKHRDRLLSETPFRTTCNDSKKISVGKRLPVVASSKNFTNTQSKEAAITKNSIGLPRPSKKCRNVEISPRKKPEPMKTRAADFKNA
jgi:hypothetical protein